MSSHPGPFSLVDTRLVLGPEGVATPRTVSSTFYQDLDAAFDGFVGHMLVAEHSFQAAWSTWEMHPKGDEFVYLLEGDAEFVLWTDGAENKVRLHQPGQYVVVPKGNWHTLRPQRPSRMLFVTPGEGTRNAARPEP